jgi:translocation and assembly module TamB
VAFKARPRAPFGAFHLDRIAVTQPQPRDFGRIVAQVLCALFGLIGVLPLAAGLLLTSAPLERRAAEETARVLREKLGLTASYAVRVRLVPLELSIENLVVPASDGKGPALVAERVSVTPRVFSLLAGRLDFGDIEIERPRLRLVVSDGKIGNVKYRLPETEPRRTPSRNAPFASLSVSEGRFDVDLEGVRIASGPVDLDVFAEPGPNFEIALRASDAEITRKHPALLPAFPPPPDPPPTAHEEDILCRLDLRLRVEPEVLFVRRLSAVAAADLDSAPGTRPTCQLKDEGRVERVLLRLSQFRVGLRKNEPPLLDGHVLVRAPLHLTNRFVRTLPLRGWAAFAGDVRYDGKLKLPELRGKLNGEVEFERYKLARKLDVDLEVARDAVNIPRYQMHFADGDVVLTNARIEPFSPGVPIRVERVDGKGMQFTGLMRDLGVTPGTIVKWDLGTTRVSKIAGTIAPLKIDAEIVADTKDFQVTDRAFNDPARKHMIGVKAALVRGKLGVRPNSFDIYDTRVDFGKSVMQVGLVSIGFDNEIRIRVPPGASKLDLSDVSPLSNVTMAGKAELDVEMDGPSINPLLLGNLKVENLELGGFPVGTVTSAKVKFRPLWLEFSEVQGKKGQSNFTVSSAKLDFGGQASLVTDANVHSDSFDLRDFFAMWHFDKDPRVSDIKGRTRLDARIRYVLGGPEDRCEGGSLRASGSLRLSALDLFEERYDSGQAEFDFRWTDRDAAYLGVDLDVPSITLQKGTGSIIGSLGMRQGGLVHGQLVGTAVPLSKIDALPTLIRAAEGRVSAVAELAGTIDNLELIASGRISPVRVGRATLPSSSFQVRLEPVQRERELSGKTRCGQGVPAPFAQEEYDLDRIAGVFHVSGEFFGGQVSVLDLRTTRQRNKIVRGPIAFREFDLGAASELVPAVALSDNRPDGRLSARLQIEEFRMKAAADSRAVLSLERLTLAESGYQLELLEAEKPVLFRDGTLELPGLALKITTPGRQAASFDLAGKVAKLGATPELDATLSLRPVPLAGLLELVPRVERASGTLVGRIQVQGPLTAPRYAGGFELAKGEVLVRGLPAPISDIDLALGIDGNELSITRGSARIGGGTLQLSGGAPLRGFDIRSARLAITARQFSLPLNEGVRASADADLIASWRAATSADERGLPEVTGNVTLRSFEYKRPVTMTADISTLTQRGKRSEFETYDPDDDLVRFDVTLRALRALKIQNNLIETELVLGDEGLLLSGTNARFGLRGTVALKRGGRIMLRRSEFEVTEGRIRFDDLTRIAPEVDVTAVTEYRRYSTAAPSEAGGAQARGASGTSAQGGSWRIRLHAHGDADKLKIDLSSDPALAEDDIFLLLTVGLTRAELDQAQSASVGESVALEALGTITGADRAVTDAVPLIDEFRFGSAYSSRTGRTEPTVTIGKRLAERIRANVTSGVAESREIRSNVEWQLSNRVSVEGSYDNVNDISSSSLGNLGADVRWRLEFE